MVLILDASATMLPAALQYAAPASPGPRPGADRGLPGMWRTPCGPCFRCCANVPTGRSSDRRLKICGVLCDDMTVAPVATATSNLKHLCELV
ncbi:hypothetical protein [Alistipes sp.]|uniref:hypothetical protein n=2 Tax=Alistipes TaxID=239759 RepID=UPI0023F2CB09|nr:hypothetical protein [Alistipes sp.]